MLPSNCKIYLANFVVDMRKAIDGLSILVESHLERSPADGSIYVFLNRQRNKVKLLYWDYNGFIIVYKRLEKGCFKLSKSNGQVYSLDGHQLQWLLSGLDFENLTGHPRLNYSEFS